MLLVLDGLGWEQLQERRHLAPTLASMVGGPITTVAPSTTATALTDSIKSGRGSLGKLINDPATANALNASLKNIEENKKKLEEQVFDRSMKPKTYSPLGLESGTPLKLKSTTPFGYPTEEE